MHLDENVEGVDAEDGGGLCGGEHGTSVTRASRETLTDLLRAGLFPCTRTRRSAFQLLRARKPTKCAVE